MAAVLRDAGNTREVAEAIGRGLPVALALELKAGLALSNAQLAVLLGMSARTLARLDPAGHLDAVAGDRVHRAHRIVGLAVAVLEDPQAAVRWLKTPQRALNDALPLDLLATDVGCRAVETLLGRMEHGVYT